MSTATLPDADQLITRHEAAQRLGVSLITIDRALASGKLTRYIAGDGFHVRLDAREADALRSFAPASGPVAQ